MKKKIIVLAALLFSMSVNAQNAVGNWSLLPKASDIQRMKTVNILMEVNSLNYLLFINVLRQG